MAADISAYLNEVRSVTLDATPGDATAITLAQHTGTVFVTLLQSDDATPEAGDWSWTGTDSAAIGTHAEPISAGDTVEIQVRNGRAGGMASRILYIAADSASALAKIEQVR